MKMKCEFQVRMQQRHLKAIVGSAAQALPSGHGAGLVASAAFWTRERPCGQALPSGHGSGLLAAAQALPSGHGRGL